MANDQNLDTTFAYGSKITAREFVKFAVWDHNNTTTLDAIYKEKLAYNTAAKNQFTDEGVSNTTPSVFIPFQELFDVGKVLDYAIIQLNKQLNGDIVLTTTPNFEVSGMSLSGDVYKIGNNVMYPSTLWAMPADNVLIKSIGYLGSTFYSPAQTVSPGQINPSYSSSKASELQSILLYFIPHNKYI